VVGQAVDGQHLGARLAAAVEGDGGFRQAEGFRDQPDQGRVGLALDRSGSDADLEDRAAFGVDVPAVDAVGGSGGGEADGETGHGAQTVAGRTSMSVKPTSTPPPNSPGTSFPIDSRCGPNSSVTT